eukprot:976225_1
MAERRGLPNATKKVDWKSLRMALKDERVGVLSGSADKMPSFTHRNETAVAEIDCRVFAIEHTHAATIYAKSDMNVRMKSLLRSLPLFGDISGRSISQMTNKASIKRFTAGEIICRQGQVAHRMYIVLSGTVRVTHCLTRAVSSSTQFELGVKSQGGYFGQESILGIKKFFDSYTAVTVCELLEVELDDILFLLKQEPSIMAKMESQQIFDNAVREEIIHRTFNAGRVNINRMNTMGDAVIALDPHLATQVSDKHSAQIRTRFQLLALARKKSLGRATSTELSEIPTSQAGQWDVVTTPPRSPRRRYREAQG